MRWTLALVLLVGLLAGAAVAAQGGEKPPITRKEAKHLRQYTEDALLLERELLGDLGHLPGDLVRHRLMTSENYLDDASQLSQYSVPPAKDPSRDLDTAKEQDGKAIEDFADGKDKAGLEHLRKAIAAKKRAITKFSYLMTHSSPEEPETPAATPPAQTSFTVSLTGSYGHGTSSSNVCVDISTSPPQPGAAFTSQLSNGGIVNGTLDASGDGRAVIGISAYGT